MNGGEPPDPDLIAQTRARFARAIEAEGHPAVPPAAAEPGGVDLTWRPVAEATRGALALLGHPVQSPCLPHEADPCGAGYGMHAAAHLAVIKAIADHQLDHLGMPEVFRDVYEHKRRELADCERGPT